MITLEVYDGSTVFTYEDGDDAVLSGRFNQSQTSSEATIDQTENTLEVHGQFLGESSIFDIPAGPFRARLMIDSRVAFDGVIRKEDIQYDQALGVWALSIVNDASEVFLDRIRETSFQNTTDSEGLSCTVVDSSGATSTETVFFHELESAWNEVIAATADVEVEYQEVGDRIWCTLDVVYDDSGDVTITRKLPLYIAFPEVVSSRPLWNGRQLFEFVSSLLAWRLSASYDPFPSENIVATILSSRAVDPLTPGDVLDDVLTVEGYDVSYERPQSSDLALQYQNAVGDDDLYGSSTAPSQDAVYGAEISELDEAGVASNDNLRRITAYIPDYEGASDFNGHQPDPANHAAYTETLSLATPVMREENTIYLCGIFEESSGVWKMIVSRSPDSPGTGQASFVGEYWANNLLRNYEMQRSPRYVLEGGFDVQAVTEPVVGDPLLGSRIAGLDWMLEQKSTDVESLEADYTFSRPDVVPSVAQEQAVICRPGPLTVQCAPGGGDPNLILDWDAPVTGCGQVEPVSYDIERKGPFESSFSFVANTTDTSYDDGPIVGGPSGVYEYRVYSIGPSSEKSLARTGSVVC